MSHGAVNRMPLRRDGAVHKNADGVSTTHPPPPPHELLLTTQRHRGGGRTLLLKDWAKFSSRPLANQPFSLTPMVVVWQ